MVAFTGIDCSQQPPGFKNDHRCPKPSRSSSTRSARSPIPLSKRGSFGSAYLRAPVTTPMPSRSSQLRFAPLPSRVVAEPPSDPGADTPSSSPCHPSHHTCSSLNRKRSDQNTTLDGIRDAQEGPALGVYGSELVAASVLRNQPNLWATSYATVEIWDYTIVSSDIWHQSDGFRSCGAELAEARACSAQLSRATRAPASEWLRRSPCRRSGACRSRRRAWLPRRCSECDRG